MKCAIYIRVSTNKEEQKLSLENQRSLFLDYVSKEGWDIHDFYVDIESGTSNERSDLTRMIQDAEERKFDVIMAKELSRIARNGELSYKIRRIADENNIHIITLDKAIDTTKGDRQMFGLYAWLYEQESQRTSERIKVALRSGAMSGEFKGSIPPYGYTVREGKLVIREDATPNIVKRIYREYIDGHGTDSIARRLYNDGIPTPSQVAKKRNASDTWHGSTIKKMLTNPHYMGDLVQCRETTKDVTVKGRKSVPKKDQVIIPNSHPAIISRSDFETVQEQMKIRTRNITAPKKHLFTNVARCDDCGTGMWYRHNRKGYICGGYGRHGSKKCSHHAVKEIELKSIILSDLKQFANDVNKRGLAKRLETQAMKAQKQTIKKLSAIDKDIGRLKEKKKKYLDLLADEIISKNDYQMAIDDTNLELSNLTAQKLELQQSLLSKNVHEEIAKLKAELDNFLLFNELTEEMLHRFVRKIKIKADGTPKIFYRFSSPAA